MWNGQTEFENGVKRRVDGNFHWRVENLWHTQRVEEVEVDRGCAYIGFRWPGCEREYHSVPHFFFFSLYFFPYFSSPSLSVRSSLYQRSNDRADICVAVIEQHCFGKNLFHGIVRPRCNCAVLMSEEDVRWYRNVSFRMIDDTEM